MAFNNPSTLGGLVTANNRVGWQLVQVALLNTTAKTWTHTINSTPTGVLVFTTSGSPSPMSGTPNPAVTANATTVVYTPTSTITVNTIIMWSVPTSIIAGIEATNFV